MTHFDHVWGRGTCGRCGAPLDDTGHCPCQVIANDAANRSLDHDPPTRRGPHPAIAPPRLDAATRTLLEARGPLALAVLALGEELWAATFDPSRTPPDAVTQAFATVEAALAELRRAWRQAPRVCP